ncbi:hypothetical protein E2320_008134 [Naja naja]|nr:hypothetical protein E2320_008134 [Naja naja]
MRAKCKHCNKEMQGLVARMRQHHEKCCDEDDQRNTCEQADLQITILLFYSFRVIHPDTHSHISLSPKRKKKSFPPGTTIDKFVIKTSRLEKELIDEKIAQFVYATNSSFRLTENPHFINMVQSLRPGYSPPSRADVAGKLLDKVYDREMEQCATALEGRIVNLSIDGWSNVHNDPIVCACITTEEGKVFLAQTIDTSGNAHTAEYLQEVAVKAITTCEQKFKCLVRSLVTDNAANVSKMRRNLEEQEGNTKLITYGCSAHLLHLLAKDLKYQDQNLSAEEEELAMTWVSSNHPSVMPTIINYKAKGEPFKKYMFAEDILKKATPVNWWKSLKHLDLETVQVMISLLTAVASSAGIERIFSSFGLIHSKLRNRLGPDKAGKLVFLFQIMNKEEDEDDE